jgi:Fe-S cluster assembly ATP-binding protein
MGPNGTGKSTLASTLAGKEDYEVQSGEVIFKGKQLLEMSADERAREGVFLAFQYPVEIPGVSTTNFMKAAVNAKRKHEGLEPMDAKDFLKLMRDKLALVEMNKEFTSRSVNEGFSGGEKKRNEIFQMAMLEPSLCLLDETDSGLDIDALRIVANGVNKLRDAQRSFLVITHYQRLLNYIVPDYVHVMYGGRIVKSGGKELALMLEEKGYDWIKEEVGEMA